MERAVWMVPTPAFQLRHYALREWVPAYLRECADPPQAFRNWMQRDALFARHVRQRAEEVAGRVVVVDSTESLEQARGIVERHFGLSTTQARSAP